MYNIRIENDEINIESGGKGTTLLLEALAIVATLYDSLAKRDENLGKAFQGICENGSPFIRLTDDIKKNKDDFPEKEDQRISKLTDYIFNRSEGENEG